MKKIILLLLLIIVPNVLGSTPDFSVNELMKDEVTNGESDFGNVLFVEKPYTSEHYPRSIIQNNTFQQYDIMDWSGQSAKIIDPIGVETIIVSGSEYYFDKVGVYTIQSMINSSINGLILINPADEIEINITDIDVPKGFNLNFSNYYFVLDGENSVSLNIDVDDDVKFGNYEIKYSVNGDIYNKNVKVLKVINWTYDDSNLNKSSVVKAGEGLYIGRIVLENIGNEDVEINISKEGNETDMLGIPQPQTLYRKNVLNLDFQLQVPTIRKPGIYNYNIIIKGNEKNTKTNQIIKKIPINVTVIDSILPIIESVTFESDKVFVDNVVTVVATDNDDVDGVTLEFDGQVIDFKKDKNLFTLDYQFNKLSRYLMTVCAFDNEENRVCQDINKTFVKVDIIDGNEKVLNMDSMRFGKYSQIPLLNITQVPEGDIVVRLINYNKQSDLEPVFRIVDQDGSIKSFGKYESEVVLKNKGEYFFEVRADREEIIDGTLRVIMPEQYEEIEDITFKVEFKDYDVPKDFEINWVNGRNVVCNVKDTGNLDSSYYDCNLRYPINTRAEDISVPTTVAEKNKLKAEADEVREELANSKRKSGWIIGIMIAMFLVLILFSVYKILWFPYVRFMTGRTKESGSVKR